MSGQRPLAGRRVVVTRGVEKADRLPDLLEAAGATVLRVPLIATSRLLGDDALRAAVDRLRGATAAGRRPWVVLSSEVAAVLLLDAVGAAALGGLATAVVGPATAAALAARGVAADIVAPGQVAESLADALLARGAAAMALLVVAAAGGRTVVADRLSAAGAAVEVVEAYRSVIPNGAAERLRGALRAPLPDAIAFTSGSTVRHCAAALEGAAPPALPALCIGPVTAAAAREAGWESVVTAGEHTASGLAAAAVTLLGRAQPLP